jgi:cytochrome c
MFRLLAAAMIIYAGAANAAPDMFAFGDAKQGKKLYEEKCAACHVAQFGGDGSRVFTRAATSAPARAYRPRANRASRPG